MIGRRFDLTLLAETTGTDADDVLDLLEPAQVAGLVREEAVDTFVFEHALVRDTAYDAVEPDPQGPRARGGGRGPRGPRRARHGDRPALARRRAGPRGARLAGGGGRRCGRAARPRPPGGRVALRRRPRAPRRRPARRRPGPLRPAGPAGRRRALGGPVERPHRDGRRRGACGRRRSATPCSPPRRPRSPCAGRCGSRRATAACTTTSSTALRDSLEVLPAGRLPRPLPVPARPGPRALLRVLGRGAPRPGRRGGRDGPAPGRPDAAHRRPVRGLQRPVDARSRGRAPGVRRRVARPGTRGRRRARRGGRPHPAGHRAGRARPP